MKPATTTSEGTMENTDQRQRGCECEHHDHFEPVAESEHAYGAVPATTTVRTDYGTFHVCQACAERHPGTSSGCDGCDDPQGEVRPFRIRNASDPTTWVDADFCEACAEHARMSAAAVAANASFPSQSDVVAIRKPITEAQVREVIKRALLWYGEAVEENEEGHDMLDEVEAAAEWANGDTTGLLLPALPSVETVLSDPATSYWLRDALRAVLDRDPVDALRDAELLSSLLHDRLTQAWLQA